tara:strand:- start:10158 stop:10415 length:258 start_codon:yes stop_codon:yes gene_type:complete
MVGVMTSPLYCGENGCTLHDYKVSPVYCEYEYAKLQRKRRDERIEKLLEDTLQKLYEVMHNSPPQQVKNSGSRPTQVNKGKQVYE